MRGDKVKNGLRVKIAKLGSTVGMLISDTHLSVRKIDITGVVINSVPGHGGDVWFVRHDGSDDVGAYVYDEFEEVKN